MAQIGFIVLSLLIAASAAVPLSNEIEGAESTAETLQNLSKCAESGGITGVANCVALRTLKSLQMVSRQSTLEILPGISLENDGKTRVGKELNELQENDLPENPQERAERLYDMLLDNSAKVVSGRTLKVKLPEDIIENVSRAIEEGRKKKKGGMFPFMLRLGAKMMGMVPAALAALGLLASKALIVAKIALALSAIVFFQGFFSKGSGLLSNLGGLGHSYGGSNSYNYGTGFGSYSPPTWTTNNLGGGNQYPYARSIDVAEGSSTKSAQDLAYSQQK